MDRPKNYNKYNNKPPNSKSYFEVIERFNNITHKTLKCLFQIFMFLTVIPL